MFTAYTPLDRCVGKEIRVRCGGEEFVGMLAGMYRCEGQPMLVITPLNGGGTEHHIPLVTAVVKVQHDR
ncbi:MAG: hypothetical protein ACOY93_11980 [Bacillota bacterium]